MSDFAIIYSDCLEDLIFAREKTDKILRYASDFLMLRRITEKFGVGSILAKKSFVDGRLKSFVKECSADLYEFSALAEFDLLLEKLDSKANEISAAPKNIDSSIYKNLCLKSQTFSSLVGRSSVMQRLRSEIARIADFDVSVLILGETGTGKTTIARSIHELSHRRKNPFKSCVLSNSNETLIESKLFGVNEGGFTGAVAGKGLFEECDGGTLFLDEIGEISVSTQTKLLQVLSEGVINRIGSNRDISVDNRMIFATNANLETKIKLGEFREDLFYRVNDVTIRIPPLRERLEDIPDLCHEILRREKINKKISDSAISVMQTFLWKGNIRQLEKCIRNAALLYCDGDIIEPKDIKL